MHVIRWYYGLLGTKEFLTSVGILSGRNTISYPVCYAVVGCLAPFVNRDVDAVCRKEKTWMKGSLVFMREKCLSNFMRDRYFALEVRLNSILDELQRSAITPFFQILLKF